MKNKKAFSLEKGLKDLRKIVENMQSGKQDFDDNVSLFKEGKALIENCNEYLDESEFMIKKLIDAEDGETDTEEL